MEKEGKQFKLQRTFSHSSSFLDYDTSNNNNTRYDSTNMIVLSNRLKRLRPNKKKINNFYRALDLIKSANISSGTYNVSEFSEANVNLSKEEKVQLYLHRPLIKTIVKSGNNLLRLSYGTYSSESSINIPYKMNFRNIFEKFLPEVIEVESDDDNNNNQKSCGNTNNITNNNPNEIHSNINNNNSKIYNKHNNNINSQSTFNDVHNNNKKSTAGWTYTNDDHYLCNSNNNNNIKEVHPFLLDIENPLSHRKNNNIIISNRNNEMLVVDSDNENKNYNDVYVSTIKKDENNYLYSNKGIEFTNLKEYHNNHNYIKNRTTTDKKIPKKFKHGKLTSEFGIEEGSDVDYNVNNCNNKKQIGTKKGITQRKMHPNQILKKLNFDNVSNDIDDYEYSNNNESIGNVNKNLIDKFNTCSNDKESKSKDPSVEMLEFLSLDDGNGVNNNNVLQGNVITSTSFLQITERNNTSVNEKENTNKVSNLYSTPKKYKKTFNVMSPCKLRNVWSNNNNYYTKTKTKPTHSRSLSSQQLLFSPGTNYQNINSNNKNINSNNNNNWIYYTPPPNQSPILNCSGLLSHSTSEQIIPQTIYDLDFYTNLLQTEQKQFTNLNINYITNHSDLTWDNRSILTDYLMQICEEFAFKRDTFHYAVNYLDRFLSSSTNIPKSKLQLIGVTCIGIAGKIEEVQIPKLLEYSNISNNLFTVNDIINYEQTILSHLKWNIIPITINTWLNWYICQWDLFIDTVDDIKERLIHFIPESQLIYFKKSNDESYYNYRKITQIIDLIVIDYNHLKYNKRYLVAAAIFIVILLVYGMSCDIGEYNYTEGTKEKEIWDIYSSFVNQSFDVDVYDYEMIECLKYVALFKEFEFNYELPLIYQIEETACENGNYEELVSYQTYNEKNLDYLKQIYCADSNEDSSDNNNMSHQTDKNE